MSFSETILLSLRNGIIVLVIIYDQSPLFAKDQMKIVINPMEIDATRMGVRHDHIKLRDILVKFKNQSLHNILYQKKRMLRKETQQVFINEHLTTRRSQLFYQVRQMRKQRKVHGTWTQSGNILVKINEDSTPIAVTNIKAVKSLIDAGHDAVYSIPITVPKLHGMPFSTTT